VVLHSARREAHDAPSLFLLSFTKLPAEFVEVVAGGGKQLLACLPNLRHDRILPAFVLFS
jgi:hypothetical protein